MTVDGMERAIETRESSFEAWYEQLAPRLTTSLRAVVADGALAEDLAAETFARALARWDRLSTEVRSLDAWAYRVAFNLVRRQFRNRAASPGRYLVERTDDPPLDVDLVQAVRSLPRRQREVVVLRYVADRKEREIAEILGISEGAVSASLVKARNGLRSRLGGTDG